MIGVPICSLVTPTMNRILPGINSYDVRNTSQNTYLSLCFADLKILKARSFRLHRDEAARLNLTDSILAQPGDDFATELGIVHNLHCLVRISIPSLACQACVCQLTVRHRGAYARYCTPSITIQTPLKRNWNTTEFMAVRSS